MKSYTSHTNTAISAMEYIYFARPDSTILWQKCSSVRKASGKKLAQESPANRYGYWCTQLIIISTQVGMLKKVTYLMKWGW